MQVPSYNLQGLLTVEWCGRSVGYRHWGRSILRDLDAEWEVADDVLVTEAQLRLLLHHPRPTTRQLSSSLSRSA